MYTLHASLMTAVVLIRKMIEIASFFFYYKPCAPSPYMNVVFGGVELKEYEVLIAGDSIMFVIPFFNFNVCYWTYGALNDRKSITWYFWKEYIKWKYS